MEGVFVGIDVGGTHTDGVAVAGGRIVHKVKVPTRSEDLRGCTLEVLGALLEELSPGAVRTLQAAAELSPERLGALRLSAALAAEVVPFLDAALEHALGRRPNSLASLPGFGTIDPPPRGLVP